MHHFVRLRLEPIRLPIVEVDFATRVFNDPRLRRTLVGGRRRIVDAALLILEEAKQNQIDGCIELDERHIRVVLLAVGITQAWMRDLLFFRLDGDEQT